MDNMIKKKKKKRTTFLKILYLNGFRMEKSQTTSDFCGVEFRDTI